MRAKAAKGELAIANGSFFQFHDPKEKIRDKLIRYVVIGDQINAERLLMQFPKLLLKRGKLMDASGRVFENISVWEYSIWAMDVYMLEMMLNTMPERDLFAISSELKNQFNTLRSVGLSYEYNKQRVENELHYNFALIQKLKHYCDHYIHWDWKERESYWCKEVGEAQWLTVAHIAQHYCDNGQAFDSNLSFAKKNWLRTLKFFNWVSLCWDSWFSSRTETTGLGVDFAIQRGDSTIGARGGIGSFDAARLDLEALIKLFEDRKADMEVLDELLSKLAEQEDLTSRDCLSFN